MPADTPWDQRDLPTGRWLHTAFGPLHALLFNRGDEWQIASWPEGAGPDLAAEGAAADLPPDLAWTRFSSTEDDTAMQLRPAFPDLPIMTKPREPFTIAPRGDALFYVGIPASLQILASTSGEVRPLLTLPSQPLTKSWHGNRSTGNVCFAIRTRARRVYQADDWPPEDIVCAIDLKNELHEAFPFESLYLHTGHLAIFEQDGRLWSNAARVRIDEEGGEEHNDVTYAPKPLSPANDARELAPPRNGRLRRSKLQSAFSSFIDVLH